MSEGEDHGGTGHRARLRKRLFEGGSDALLDHEVVEYLLATAQPRGDTKPLARALLKEFGGIPGLFAADAESLRRVPGMGDAAIAAIRIVDAAALRLLRAHVEERPVLGSWQALLDYLRADMAGLAIERVRVLHMNARNLLIRDEVMSEGSVDQAPIYTREVIKRALEIGSASIILVHNHPAGDPAPSRQDIAMTRTIVEAAKPLGIALHDHIIIGMRGHSSMRALGLI